MTPAEVRTLTLAEHRAFVDYQNEWIKRVNEANKRR